MSNTPKLIIEESTNYAFALRKNRSKDMLSFQSIRDTSIRFFQMLPDDLRNELYNEIQRGICPLDSEPRLNAYMFSFGKMHNAKLRRAYDNLSPEFRQHQTIDIVDYGCGQAIGCICYADFLRENGIRQRVRRVVLIEPSGLALARAALHVSLLFPDAEIHTVCKGFDDLLPEELCSDADVPTLHILSNVLDIGDKFYSLDKFADLVSGVLKGDNEFVCVGPRYGNQNDLKIDQFMEHIDTKTYYATQYRAGELAAGETWTGIICCGSKHKVHFQKVHIRSKEIFKAPEMFDWDAYEEEMYDYNHSKANKNEVVEGVVSTISQREVLVNVGNKCGVIAATEFQYNPELKVGDKVEVYVESTEDHKDQFVISHKKARRLCAWDKINRAFDNTNIVNGYVKTFIKGGLIVDVFGIETFLPYSQIDVIPIHDYKAYIGQTMDFKIIKINQEFRNAVISHRAVFEENYSIDSLEQEYGDDDAEEWMDELYEEEKIDERYWEAYNNPPPLYAMRYTYGRFRPCPYCGSDNIQTFMDGTALCSSCYQWYRYA